MDDLLDGDASSVSAVPPLSKRSALNDRYFEVRRSHQQLSSHNDSISGHDDLQSDAGKFKLNKRYIIIILLLNWHVFNIDYFNAELFIMFHVNFHLVNCLYLATIV